MFHWNCQKRRQLAGARTSRFHNIGREGGHILPNPDLLGPGRLIALPAGCSDKDFARRTPRLKPDERAGTVEVAVQQQGMCPPSSPRRLKYRPHMGGLGG